MATHSGILAWKIQWTEKPGGLQSMGSQRVSVLLTNMFSQICWHSSSNRPIIKVSFSRLENRAEGGSLEGRRRCTLSSIQKRGSKVSCGEESQSCLVVCVLFPCVSTDSASRVSSRAPLCTAVGPAELSRFRGRRTSKVFLRTLVEWRASELPHCSGLGPIPF